MTISTLYPFLRSLLGDRQVMGAWHYSEADLLSAVRTAFAAGRSPSGYSLVGSLATATAITPEMSSGDAMARLLYASVLILIAGEDGAKSIRTRELTVTDGGHRKRDLLSEMRLQIHRIESGDCVFSTQQSLAQFLTGGPLHWPDHAGITVQSLGDIRV